MTITVLNEQRRTELTRARANGDSLWLEPTDLERATGWALKSQGLCKDELCIPVTQPVRDAGGEIDAAALWQSLGHPVAHDASGRHWVLGTGARARGSALQSLQAPNFELPDIDGRPHRLSDYRGQKVLLITWASW